MCVFEAVMGNEPAGRLREETGCAAGSAFFFFFSFLLVCEACPSGVLALAEDVFWEAWHRCRPLVGLQDKAHLHQTRTQLQQARDPPRPVTRDVVCAKADRRRHDLPDEVRHVEERGQYGSFFGVGELADEGRAGDDARWDAEAENHSRDDVHGHFLLRGRCASQHSVLEQQEKGKVKDDGCEIPHRAERNPGSAPQ